MADVNTAVEDVKAMGPPPTAGFGPRELADAFRMSQQKTADDAIADLDMNSLYARVQGATQTLQQANFEANAGRLNKLFDHFAAVLASKP